MAEDRAPDAPDGPGTRTEAVLTEGPVPIPLLADRVAVAAGSSGHRLRTGIAATLRWPAAHPRGWRIVKLVVALGLLAIAAQVMLNTYGELQVAAETLTRIDPWWVVPAVVCEALSYTAYASAQRVLLRSGGTTVGIAPLTGIVVAGQAASNCLPGGIAISSLVMYRQLRRRQVPDVLTGWMIVVCSLLYGSALAVLALIGVQIAGSDNSIPVLRIFSVAVAGVLLALLLALSTARRWLPRLRALNRWGAVAGFFDRLSTVSLSPWAGGGAFALMCGSWLADLGTLICAHRAIGAQVPWQGLLVAYCAGQMVASIPITPGGLGIAEGSLTVALVAFGGAKTVTLAAVLLYRLVAYWALLPSGAIAYALLRRSERQRSERRLGGARCAG